jgi:hypothetical protein
MLSLVFTPTRLFQCHFKSFSKYFFSSLDLFWLVLHNPCVDWHMKSLQFKTPKHKALECETFIRNIHGKNQDGVCHVTKSKHGDECMQNLKQKEDLGSTRRPKCPKHLFIETKAFM